VGNEVKLQEQNDKGRKYIVKMDMRYDVVGCWNFVFYWNSVCARVGEP